MDTTTDDERELLEAFRACDAARRAALAKFARALARGGEPDREEDLLRRARSRGIDVGAARVAIRRAIGDPVYELRRAT